MREVDLSTGPRGLRLRLCAWGPDTGRAVLVLHGFLEQGAAWDAVARRLARRVVAPDHRGHGLSEHVGRGGFYHFWDYVSDTRAVAEHLGGPVDVVGHSMGGTIAALLAATRPDLVRRLVLVEGLGPPDLTPLAVERARSFVDALAEPPRHAAYADVDAAAARMTRVNPRLDTRVARRLALRITRPVLPSDPQVRPGETGVITWTWDALHRARNPVPFRADLHTRFLARIEAPTLRIDGGDSTFRPEDSAARAAAIPDVRHIVVPGAGHLVHHDAPDALTEAIATFLDA